jgi:hypothetical protein
LSKGNLSKLTGVATSSVRFDVSIPVSVAERLRELANIANLVGEYFDGDVQKVGLWFELRNPMLGNISQASQLCARRMRSRKCCVRIIRWCSRRPRRWAMQRRGSGRRLTDSIREFRRVVEPRGAQVHRWLGKQPSAFQSCWSGPNTLDVDYASAPGWAPKRQITQVRYPRLRWPSD